MALFNTLKQILTPYANKINLHTEEIEEIQSDVSEVKSTIAQKSEGYIVSASGATVEIVTDETQAKPLREIYIEGKSVQDGTPTPENAVAIVGYGTLDDVSYYTDISVKNNGVETTVRIGGMSSPLYDGDIIDLFHGKVYRYNKILTLNGSENWTYNSNVSTSTNLCITLISSLPADYGRRPMLCNRFVNNLTTNIQSATGDLYIGQFGSHVQDVYSNYIYFRVPASILSAANVGAWKTWLASNNLIVVVRVKNPVEEAVTVSTDVSGMNGVVRVSCDTSVTVRYAANIADTLYALTSEVDVLTGEVDSLTGEVDSLTGEVVFPPTFEIDLSDYNSVKIYGTAIFYTYSTKYDRRIIRLADVPNTIAEASWDAVNSVLTINMPGESILLLDPIANTFTLQKNNWKVHTGKKVLLYRYYASYGGLLFDTSFTRRFDKKVKDVIDVYSPKESLIDHFHEQIGHVYGAADYYRSANFIKDFTMLMISDTHEDNEEIVRAVEITDGVSAIDCLCHLGDIGGQRTAAQITSGKNKAVQFIQQANPQKPFFFAMGNHDEQNDATAEGNGTVAYGVSTIIPYINTASIYNERGYGYYDFPTYKIRMIVLNSFDYPDTISDNKFVFYEDYICWQEEQANFFVNTLSSTPADYTVIVCSHWCELGNVDNTKINQHWGATKQTSNNRTTVGSKTYMSDTVMSDIINAYKNRTTLSKSYSYTKGVTSVSYTITADFTNTNGTFAIWLAGHRHLSGVARSAIGDYWIYVNDTSCCGTLTGAWATDYTNMPRSRDSADTRDLMTCLSIDTGNRLLKFTRIGAHVNRFLDDENYLVLSY